MSGSTAGLFTSQLPAVATPNASDVLPIDHTNPDGSITTSKITPAQIISFLQNSTPVTTRYASASVLRLTDRVALLTTASPAAFSLASGVFDGQQLTINNKGASATVSLNLEGNAQSVILQQGGFLELFWDLNDVTWLARGAQLGSANTSSSLDVDTPAQAVSATSTTITGPMVGNASALQYNWTGDALGWRTAPSPTLTPNVGYSFTVAGGFTAGSGTLQVRDANNNSVVSPASGTFIVAAFNPLTITTSTPVFWSDPNDPALVGLDVSGNISTLKNKINTSRTLQAQLGASSIPIQWKRNTGSDSRRRIIAFHVANRDDTTADPLANCLVAGGTSGPSALLVAMPNGNSSTTSFSIVQGAYFDTSSSVALIEATLIWANVASNPTQYISAARWHGGGIAFQLHDGTNAGQANTSVSDNLYPSGWYVVSSIKNGTTMTIRVNKAVLGTYTVPGTISVTFTEAAFGGGYVGSGAAVLPQPTPYGGALYAGSGVLSGTELTSMESLVGNSIGISI